MSMFAKIRVQGGPSASMLFWLEVPGNTERGEVLAWVEGLRAGLSIGGHEAEMVDLRYSAHSKERVWSLSEVREMFQQSNSINREKE